MATPKRKRTDDDVVITDILHYTGRTPGDSKARRGRRHSTLSIKAYFKRACNIEDREPNTERQAPQPREEADDPDPPGGIISGYNGQNRPARQNGGGGGEQEGRNRKGTMQRKTLPTHRKTLRKMGTTAAASTRKSQTGPGSGTTSWWSWRTRMRHPPQQSPTEGK